MRPGLVKAIVIRTAAVIAMLVFSVAMIVALGIYQTVYPHKIASMQHPDALGLEYEDVNVHTEDGLRIAGWYIPRVGAPSDSAVIVLHGYPTEKGDLLQRSAFLLADHDLFLIDFRYFGASEGDHTTLGFRETDELRAAVDHVINERQKRSVGVYGFSMGAAVALMGMDTVPGIDAVVAEASYADLYLMAQELYRSFGPLKVAFADLTSFTLSRLYGVDISSISPARAVKGSGKPVLLIHSRNDQVIPFTHAEMLKEGLKDDPNAEFIFGEELLHGQASVEYATRMKEFFLKHLSASEPPSVEENVPSADETLPATEPVPVPDGSNQP